MLSYYQILLFLILIITGKNSVFATSTPAPISLPNPSPTGSVNPVQASPAAPPAEPAATVAAPPSAPTVNPVQAAPATSPAEPAAPVEAPPSAPTVNPVQAAPAISPAEPAAAVEATSPADTTPVAVLANPSPVDPMPPFAFGSSTASVQNNSPVDGIKEFDKYSRPQLYFSSAVPWRVIYYSPNIAYQGVVPVEGDTNLSYIDKRWCLNLKTMAPDKSCGDFNFFKKVTEKCEDVQVLSCVEHAKVSNWAKETWKKPQDIWDGLQSMFHKGMENRMREFVDRGGKLPWVPTPTWCMNISPKSCSDLPQVDPRNGVNQGGKNFMISAENCHFYEIANCTQEAIESNWAKQKWGDHPDIIRKNINSYLFEKHLQRIAKKFPASLAVSLEEAQKAQMMGHNMIMSVPSFSGVPDFASGKMK